MQKCSLYCVPAFVYHLVQLRFLDLSYNPLLEKLDANFARLLCNLEHILLTNCGFRFFPTCLNDMPYLTTICFSDHVGIGDPLRTLHLTAFYLRCLDLSKCGLDAIPASLYTLSILHTLILNGNRICDVPIDLEKKMQCIRQLGYAMSHPVRNVMRLSKLKNLTAIDLPPATDSQAISFLTKTLTEREVLIYHQGGLCLSFN